MKRFLLALAIATGFASGASAQGTIRLAVGTTLNQLDPAKTTIGDEYIYVHLVFNGLTRIDRDLTTKPDLAVSWTASEDLKEWTFKLRDGREVPPRPHARCGRRRCHHPAHPRSRDRLARARQPDDGREGRGRRSVDRQIHAQHPVCGLSRHLRRAAAAHRGQGPGRCAVHGAGRHRPVPVRLVGAGRPHGAGRRTPTISRPGCRSSTP